MFIMFLLVFLIFSPAIFVFIDFLGFLVKGHRILGSMLQVLSEIGALLILPFIYAGFGQVNECCGDEIDTAAFGLPHQLTIFVWMTLALVSYCYSRIRSRIAPPFAEVLVNVFLASGIVLAGVMCFHTGEAIYAIFGAVPVMMLGIMMLAKNQILFLEQFARIKPANTLELYAWRFLCMKPLLKFPVLFMFCLPVLLIVSVVLLLFGQKPDAVIRAFTETYKHGLSAWDYKCDNVECGGHYLCSVAAKGHKQLVKPSRFGVRNGGRIICNRQLLISNAFEDLLKEKWPRLHTIIRTRYNKVGNLVHRYYFLFNIKLVSDCIYLLMKPLEWIFLLVLYAFDKKPENRIAMQYISRQHRECIEKQMQENT